MRVEGVVVFSFQCIYGNVEELRINDEVNRRCITNGGGRLIDGVALTAAAAALTDVIRCRQNTSSLQSTGTRYDAMGGGRSGALLLCSKEVS